MSNDVRPTVALTLGDPSGVGGELAVKLLASGELEEQANVLVIASRAELDRAMTQANISVDVAAQRGTGRPTLIDPGREQPLPTDTGAVSTAAGSWTMAGLEFAVDLARRGEADAICFMPLNKTALSQAGMTKEDELRWFADLMEYTGVTSEINVIPGLWTSRITSHIPLSEVAEQITAERVTTIITMFDEMLRDSGFTRPRIGVAALNPHNGEGGLFGRHEIDEIRPGIETAQRAGIDVQGTYPSDTIFVRARDDAFDGIVTMYHDQGQIAMKLMGFDGGVTIQGGLPIPITTPAHGTAFEIVGQGIAKTTSAENAFRIAATLGARSATRVHS